MTGVFYFDERGEDKTIVIGTEAIDIGQPLVHDTCTCRDTAFSTDSGVAGACNSGILS